MKKLSTICRLTTIIASTIVLTLTPIGFANAKAPVPAQQKQKELPKPGYAAPHFVLKDLDNSAYTIGGTRSKLLVLNFWASWCEPCVMEAPSLNALYKAYRNQLDLYAVNATAYDREVGARAFVEKMKLSFPILLDVSGSVTDLYKVNSFPTSLIMDKQGMVVERITGIITQDEWEARLKPYL